MAKKKVYRLLNHCQGKEKEQRAPIIRSQFLPWQRSSQGAQVAPQRCPILLPGRIHLLLAGGSIVAIITTLTMLAPIPLVADAKECQSGVRHNKSPCGYQGDFWVLNGKLYK
jgi:hypothetical protein